MDEKFIYYLVLGAIYLVSRMLKKKKPVAPTPTKEFNGDSTEGYQRPQVDKPVSKPSSFEDLLKEISQEFEHRKEPAKPIERVIEPVEKALPVETKPELTREQKYVNKKHAEAKELRKKEELLELAQEENAHEPHPVLELLNEEGGAANAVVLAEILNRRI